MPCASADDVRDAERRRRGLAERRAADDPLARRRPPRHVHRACSARSPPPALVPAVLPWAYAWRAGEALQRGAGEPVRDLVHVAGRPDAGAEVSIRSSTMMPPVEPSLRPGRLGEPALSAPCGWRRPPGRRGSRRPEVAHGADPALASPRNPSSVVLKCMVHAQLAPGLLDRRHDVGVGHHRQRRTGCGSTRCVSTPRCASAVDHLQAERAGLDDHGASSSRR